MVLGITIIVISENDAQLVFNAILPLFGTWVGTVLAYFFSRESFEAASQSVERISSRLIEQKLQSVLVSSVMVPRSQMFVSKEPAKEKLMDTLAQLEGRNLSRLPILDQNDDHPLFLVYKEDIVEYLYRMKAGISEEDRKKLTVQNLLEENSASKKQFAVVKESGSLLEAQEAMNRMSESRVIFVTKSGSETDAVVGMLTSIDIAKRAQV
jgi:CBS domain containing-hemolysin-like protein